MNTLSIVSAPPLIPYSFVILLITLVVAIKDLSSSLKNLFPSRYSEPFNLSLEYEVAHVQVLSDPPKYTVPRGVAGEYSILHNKALLSSLDTATHNCFPKNTYSPGLYALFQMAFMVISPVCVAGILSII